MRRVRHSEHALPRRRRRWWWYTGLTALVLGVLAAGTALAGYHWADSRLRHTTAFTGYEGRPAPSKGTNWLIIGTDTRSDLSPRQRDELHVGGGGERNTDTVMLLHYGRTGPYLVSIPRDSYLPIPGHGKNKINAAYALGGAPLLTRTVEQATGLRLDHYAEIDFLGFVKIVEALGGVEICLREPLEDEHSGAHLPAGCRLLDGRETLAYVRARYSDPRGDLGRVERQRNVLTALRRQISDPATVLDPSRARPLLRTVLDAVTVDGGTDVMSLARMTRDVGGLTDGRGSTTTVPVANPGVSVPQAGDVLLWDKPAARELFDQLRRDVPITGSRMS